MVTIASPAEAVSLRLSDMMARNGVTTAHPEVPLIPLIPPRERTATGRVGWLSDK